MPEPSDVPWAPSGVLTLTTDFGLDDSYVGILKGVVSQEAPGVQVVDITHAVEPQDVLGAAFHLRTAARWFPQGTVHVAVVDPGVGTARRSLIAHANGHVFVAPDNGLLPAALAHFSSARYGELDTPRFLRIGASRTFHARDLYVPLGARLALGDLDPDDAVCRALGPQDVVQVPAAALRVTADSIEGSIIHVDRFGNLISNLGLSRPEVADALRPVGQSGTAATVTIAGRRAQIVGTYGDASVGDLVALVDSFRLVEVAVVGGSAAQVLGVGRGTPVVLARG